MRETHINVLQSEVFIIILSHNNWQKSKQTGANPLKFRPHSAIAQSKSFKRIKVFYAIKLLWRLLKNQGLRKHFCSEQIIHFLPTQLIGMKIFYIIAKILNHLHSLTNNSVGDPQSSLRIF